MKDDPELSKIALEQARLDLALKQLQLDQGKQNKFPIYWTSPLILALITGIFGIFASGISNFIQGLETAKLERQKFESSAILKALDTQDKDKAANLLVFLVKTKIISDPTGIIAGLEKHPETTPINPTGSTKWEDRPHGIGLAPEVAVMEEQLFEKAKQQGIILVEISGFRSYADQDKLYAQGRTTPGHIVTAKRGGMSPHNCGLAFDVIPTTEDRQNLNWQGQSDAANKIVVIAKSLGLEWGGDWKGSAADFVHFQKPGAKCQSESSPSEKTTTQ